MSSPKQLIIIAGSYAKSGTGNFTARTADGASFFVPAQAMLDLGIAKDTMPTFPMYAFGMQRMIGSFVPGTTEPLMEADGVTPVLTARDEITALFKDRKSFIDVANASFALSTEMHTDRHAIAVAAGLSEESIETLLAASI